MNHACEILIAKATKKSSLLYICNIYLFPVLVFKSGVWLWIAPVPFHCFPFTFNMNYKK